MTISTPVERRRLRARRALLSFTTILCSGLAVPAYAEDARWTFPQQLAMSPHGVNLQTGRFIHSVTDISIGSLKFVRSWGEVPSFTASSRSIGFLNTYSADSVQSWMPTNVGWTHNFNEGIYYWPGNDNSAPQVSVIVDSKIYLFSIIADGTAVPADQTSQGTLLNGSSTQWIFTDKSGAIFTFFQHPAIQQSDSRNLTQLLQSVSYANGNRLDYSYTAAGQPSFIRSNTGYAIGIDYNSFGNVSAVCGFNLTQGYADSSAGCGSAPLKVSYAYDGTGDQLASVTDPLGHVVSYTYTTPQAGFSLPTCLSLPDSATCELQNIYGQQPADVSDTFADQVRKQTTASGAVWQYSYRPQPDPADLPVVAGNPRYSAAQMIDPLGQRYGFRYDRGHLIMLGTPAGITQYRYRYYARTVGQGSIDPRTRDYFDIRPALIIPPENNREFIAHDNRGNLLQHSYWPKDSANPVAPSDPNQQNCCTLLGVPQYPVGSVTYVETYLPDYGYEGVSGSEYVVGCGSGPADAKRCDKALSRTDSNGNETDYTYDPANGGVLTETGAPDANGVRPQTRYTYVQRQAWVAAPGGGYTTAGDPVWLLGSKSLCRSGNPDASGVGCATSGDEVKTLYEYGLDSQPNNLLLRGIVEDATGTAARTCYAYDTQGNKVSETKPRAGLSVCP